MSVRVKVRISKIMRTSIKVGVRTYATYTNCRTLTIILIIWLLLFLQGKARFKSRSAHFAQKDSE